MAAGPWISDWVNRLTVLSIPAWDIEASKATQSWNSTEVVGYKTANTNTAKLQESEHKTMKQQITKLQNRGKNKNTTKKFRELTSEDTFF